MALHSSDNRHLGVSPFGTVMKEGYSFDLGLDQTGIFSKSKRKTSSKGLMALSDFSKIDNELEDIAIFYGTKKDSGRMGSYKNSRTVDFSLSEIKKVGIAHPKQTEQKFDYWRVGWDGLHANTSLKFSKGQTLEFQMTIGGTAVTFFNSDSCYTVKVPVNVPNLDSVGVCDEIGDVCEPVDCREITLKLVKDLNNYYLPGGQVLSNYFDIYPIFSTPTNPATPIVYKQWCLEYCGFGGLHELSAVSAQYPGHKVTRDTMTGKFVLFAPASFTPKAFKQTKADILKGCADCPAGYDLIPDGIVYAIAIEDDGADKKADILKGCADCPAGYDLIPDGIVYAIAIEDDGADKKADIQALPNAVAGSAIKTGQDFGVGHYLVVLSKELTKAEEKTFTDSNPTAIVLVAGTKKAFCQDDTVQTHAWVECGQCEATEATYRIMVPDDCHGSKFEEIKDAYPDLTITKVAELSKNCISMFETKVMTNFSCSEGCSPAIIQQVFDSKAPVPFGINQYWFPHVVATTADPTISCGFEIKAKPIVLSASECTLEELPFVMTSTRIENIAGGYPIDYSLNSIVPIGTWAIRQLERAQDLDNLGGHLRGWEQKGRFYFRDEKPYRTVLQRELTGTVSRLDNLTQYSDLFVTIEGSNKAGINSKEYTYITYHILVPYGRTTELEGVFKNLAGAAGVPFQVK